jgi:hypothetical protein
MIPDHELLDQQNRLQEEASRVLELLGLPDRLCVLGRPVIVGSVALGLMAWRDIDIEVYCESVDADAVFEVARPLASIPGVYKINFHDWRGSRAVPDVPDGYYCGVGYRSPEGNEWKLDLWFVQEDTSYRMGGTALEPMRDRLTPQTRLTILWLKQGWHRHPQYRKGICSVDIYDAVLEHGVETSEQFERYLRDREKLP